MMVKVKCPKCGHTWERKLNTKGYKDIVCPKRCVTTHLRFKA